MVTRVWNKLEEGISQADDFGSDLRGFYDISKMRLNSHSPEVMLWLGVLLSAGRDKDKKFVYKYGPGICNKAKLDYKQVKKAFEFAWESK